MRDLQIRRIGDLDIERLTLYQLYRFALRSEDLARIGKHALLIFGQAIEDLLHLLDFECLRRLTLIQMASVGNVRDDLAIDALNDRVGTRHDRIAHIVFFHRVNVVFDDAVRDEGTN